MLAISALARSLTTCALASLSFAEVHVVEFQSSSGLTTVQAAVYLAADGDTIVVRYRRIDNSHMAVDLRNRSFAWIGLSHVEGGPGGYADCTHNVQCTALGGDGGIGIRVEPGSLCVQLESEFLPGEAGQTFGGAMGGGTHGSTGTAIVGSVQTVPGAHRDIDAPISAPSDGSVHLVLRGEPGERVMRFIGDGGGHRFLGWQSGVLLVNGGLIAPPTEVGVVPASGVLEVDVAMPQVEDDAARTLQIQALFRTSATRFRLSPARAVTVMGDATPYLERPSVVHVNAHAPVGGFGRSWQYAARTLHGSVGSLPFGPQHTQVWIGQGTYTPAPAADPLGNARLETIGNFDLLGGFAGTETSVEQRDPKRFPCVLTGDLLGDDRLPGGSRAENSRGLLYVRTYTGDRHFRFSGVPLRGSHYGAAIDFYGDELLVDDCAFLDNEGLNHAAAISAHWFGPADTVKIRSSRFHRNTANAGGAISLDGEATAGRVVIEGCEFIGNAASQNRWNVGAASSVQYGGAFHAHDTAIALDIRDSTFVDNDKETLWNTACSFGGVFVEPETVVTLVNSILWSHRVDSGLESAFSTVSLGTGDLLRSNCVHWLPPGWDAHQNLVAPPGFVRAVGPDGVWASGDENLRLGPGSPCIDARASELVPPDLTLDLNGSPRFVDDPTAPNVGTGGTRIVDMGAYERQTP